MIKESDSLKLPLRYKVTSHNGIEIHEASEYKPNVFTLVCSIKGCHISIVKLFIQTVNSFDGLVNSLKETLAALEVEIASTGGEWKHTREHAEQAIAQAEL